jgi:hypothetical protein
MESGGEDFRVSTIRDTRIWRPDLWSVSHACIIHIRTIVEFTDSK